MNPERRIYPRIHVELPAEVEANTGETADVTVLNLSVGGLLVEGGAELAGLKPPVEGVPLELKLHFGLDDEPLHCHCRVVYNQRLSQFKHRFGLTILSMDQPAIQHLQAFIESRLK